MPHNTYRTPKEAVKNAKQIMKKTKCDGVKLEGGKRIYETCQRLMDMGYTINRPPRDGHMAFVRSPDKISIEILQEGNLEPKEPWASMENTGTW